jgi:integrase/recombinase XerD
MSQQGNTLPAIVSPMAETAELLPPVIAAAGAGFAWEEFFLAEIRNPHTRKAYGLAVRRFLGWCEEQGIELSGITPGMVGRYLDRLKGSVPTRKLHLAALRSFFDRLVQRHAVLLNPAASVRGERYRVAEGLTPEITADEAKALLRSFTVGHVIGLRDRAIVATLVYTAARVGAVAKLRRGDFRHDGTQYVLRFQEKGGVSRTIPVRQVLERYIRAYLDAAGITDEDKDSPLFRPSTGRRRLTGMPMSAADMGRMVKRRLKDAGLRAEISPHSFRVATITDLLAQGVPLVDVQHLAGHADPRTTRLYDRRQRQVTRAIVDRISISVEGDDDDDIDKCY